VNLLIYDELWLDINDLSSMREVIIIIHVHALYQTLLSDIQMIFVLLIFRYVEKLFKFNEDQNNDRICRDLNVEERLIAQSLCNNLSYHCKRLRIQFLINWRTKSDEWEWDDNIMLSNLILKLAHCAKDFNWVFDHTLSKLFNSTLIINWEAIRLLYLSKKITRRDFNIWKRCKKCRSFVMLKTRLD